MDKLPMNPNAGRSHQKVGSGGRVRKSAGIGGKLMLLGVGGLGGGVLASVATFFILARSRMARGITMDTDSSTGLYMVLGGAFIVGAIVGIVAIIALLGQEASD